jgi:hypothetical protein
MSGGSDTGTCECCGFETFEFWEDGEWGCDNIFCMSLYCGFYSMHNDNPKHPDYPKNGVGHHTKEEVCEIREQLGLSYGKK